MSLEALVRTRKRVEWVAVAAGAAAAHYVVVFAGFALLEEHASWYYWLLGGAFMILIPGFSVYLVWRESKDRLDRRSTRPENRLWAGLPAVGYAVAAAGFFLSFILYGWTLVTQALFLVTFGSLLVSMVALGFLQKATGEKAWWSGS